MQTLVFYFRGAVFVWTWSISRTGIERLYATTSCLFLLFYFHFSPSYYAMSSSNSTTILSIPPELLTHIFNYVCAPSGITKSTRGSNTVSRSLHRQQWLNTTRRDVARPAPVVAQDGTKADSTAVNVLHLTCRAFRHLCLHTSVDMRYVNVRGVVRLRSFLLALQIRKKFLSEDSAPDVPSDEEGGDSSAVECSAGVVGLFLDGNPEERETVGWHKGKEEEDVYSTSTHQHQFSA